MKSILTSIKAISAVYERSNPFVLHEQAFEIYDKENSNITGNSTTDKMLRQEARNRHKRAGLRVSQPRIQKRK